MSKHSPLCEPNTPSARRPGSQRAVYAPMSCPQPWVSVNETQATGNCSYVLIKSAPDVSAQEVEIPNSNAVDVTVLWGSTVLHAAHVLATGTFTVGEGLGKEPCDFFMPEQVLGVSQQTLLVIRDSIPSVCVPRQALGYFELPNQPRIPLAELRAGSHLGIDSAAGFELPLTMGSKVCLTIGDFTFHFASVRAAKSVARDRIPFADHETLSFFSLSLAAAASFMLSMAYFVPTQTGLEEQSFDEDQILAMRQFLTASAERERDAKDSDQTSNQAARDEEGGTGTRAKHEEGAMGNPTTRITNKRWAIQGPSNNPDPHVARDRLIWEAQHEAMIGLLNSGIAGDPHAPTAPWGRDSSIGRDALSANGNMWGDDIGESYGVNGLGLTGIGQGGGGLGEGIGISAINTVGHGAGRGAGQGLGWGNDNLGRGTHPIHLPRMRPGVTVVSGRLPPEVIQRIVRQNYGRFRNCYEQGLSRNPNLEGRIQVRFIIGRDGSVSNVQNGGSDLPDPGVIGCVIGAYYGLSFPQPEGGIVTVAYPIMFQPG
jgi:hypothetical protein